VWRFCQLLRSAEGSRKTGPLVAHGALLVIVIWLFWLAHTMTALACFLMATALMVATSFRPIGRRRWVVHLMIGTILALSCTALFLDVGAGLVETIGKDPTLTGRTAVWDLVISLTRHPVFGTGFESFWLGPRLDKVWSVYWWHPNEAHNGYIEVFLNLGWIGVALLTLLMVTGYRNVFRAFRQDPDSGRLRMAYFLVAVVYNFTESAVRMMHPVWICFLLATIVVPGGWTPIRTKKTVARTFSTELTPCLEEA